jgi:hypothetical protein
MATMTGLAINVTAPAVQPYRFGLFSVAPGRPPEDSHFGTVGLVGWESAWCGGAVGVTGSPCVQDNPAAIAIDSTVCNFSQFQPFWVYAYSQASAGAWLAPELEDEARARLADGEQYGVEVQLWAALDTAVTQVAVTGAPQGLAYVEQLLAQTYKAQGVLHMGRYAAQYLAGIGALEPDGQVLRTKLGTPVVAGGGYQQVAGTLPTTFDVFATGPLAVTAGAATILPATIDRAVNDIHALAFKPYAAGWDCTAVGVTITP